LKFIWEYITAKKGLFYKSLLILSSSILILYIFPLEGQFKYEFQKGRVWQYPDFYSPFDFSILKSDIEFKKDQEEVLNNLKPYLNADQKIKNEIVTNYSKEFPGFFTSISNPQDIDSLYTYGQQLLREIYYYGVLPPNFIHKGNSDILLIQGQSEISINISELFKSETLFEYISDKSKECQNYLYE